MARIRAGISDEFWAWSIAAAEHQRSGRSYNGNPAEEKRVYSDRLFFEGIVYVLRTGIIWNAFPREKFKGLGSSALHKRFQEWARAGLFEAIWRRGLAEYDELEGIAWEWQSADGTNVEAPLAQESVGPNPTDRGKKRNQASHPRRRAWRPVVDRRDRRQRS